MSIHLKSITRGQVNDYLKPGTVANFDDQVFFLYKLAFKLKYDLIFMSHPITWSLSCKPNNFSPWNINVA